MTANIDESEGGVPWPQQLLDSVWLLAMAAVLYWAIVYLMWGAIEILVVPMG